MTLCGMTDAPVPVDGGRGAGLLLQHCTALTRVGDDRPDAFARLEERVGGPLARMLVRALVGSRGERSLAA